MASTHYLQGVAWVPAIVLLCASVIGCRPANDAVAIQHRTFDEMFESVGGVEFPTDEESTIGQVAGLASWGSNFAIADPHARNVKVFSRQGRLIRVIGRAGEGPGEFRNPAGVASVNDAHLAVLDRSRRIIAVFDLAGTIVEEIDISHLGAPGDVSRSDDHFLLGVLRSDLGRSAFLLDDGTWEAIDSVGPRPMPVSRAEAAYQTAIVGAAEGSLLWGFQSRPILYRRQEGSSERDSLFLGAEFVTPWSETPTGVSGLPEWTGQNWIALRKILPLSNGEVVLRFMSGSRRRGTDRQIYVVLEPNWRWAHVATLPAGPEFWTSKGDTLYSVRVSPENGTSVMEMFVRR